MYIYELPFPVSRELCRLLDNDSNWKELAGDYMKYSVFEIDDIDQVARRQAISPTAELFTRWGQQNHRVEELFILLYKMGHIPALHCLIPLVNEKFLRLLNRNGPRNSGRGPSVDVNGNQNAPVTKPEGSQAFIPRPVFEIEQGGQSPCTSGVSNGHSPTPSNTNDGSSIISTSQDTRSQSGATNDEIFKIVSAIPMLKYEDLKVATNNWSESNLLGRGGFGQVYKGEWKLLTVAVKRLANNDGKNRELIGEMCLNQYRHDNILPLYGYSLGGPEACLVYQLMAGGSLEQRLRCKTNKPPLTWSQRHQIALGVARGLQFLHTMTGTPLVHGDIKPANILLDQCDIPKIGDFGLARKGPYGEEVTHWTVSKVHGTRPYLPDEYLRSRCLSPAVDVFSYGVVLLETATGLPPLDRARPRRLLHEHIHELAKDGAADLSSLEDRTLLPGQSNPVMTREFTRLGLQCTQPARRSRPDMITVYHTLDALTHLISSQT